MGQANEQPGGLKWDGVIRRLPHWSTLFGEDEPLVFILAPSHTRAVPAGDTRRGTAWIFRAQPDAERFAEWARERHGLQSVVLRVRLRELAAALSERDLTWVIDPLPRPGYGTPFAFLAPLPQ
jgi:hypothetical protein